MNDVASAEFRWVLQVLSLRGEAGNEANESFYQVLRVKPIQGGEAWSVDYERSDKQSFCLITNEKVLMKLTSSTMGFRSPMHDGIDILVRECIPRVYEALVDAQALYLVPSCSSED